VGEALAKLQRIEVETLTQRAEGLYLASELLADSTSRRSLRRTQFGSNRSQADMERHRQSDREISV